MASEKFYETLSGIMDTLPEVEVDQASKISNTSYRILACHANAPRQMSVDEYIGQVEASLGNNFEVVADTIQPLQVKDLYNRQFISMIVQARTKLEDFNPEKMDGFKSITANVFKDGDDTIWRLVEAGDGKKVLVQTQTEDFDAILRARMADRPATMVASFSYNGIVPSNGDFTMYYNPDNMTIEAGMAAHVDGEIVVASMNKGDNEWHRIIPEQVVETILASSIDKEHSPLKGLSDIVSASGLEPTTDDFSASMGRSVLEFYKTLFGGTDFYQKLVNGIAERRDFGKSDRPLIQNRY